MATKIQATTKRDAILELVPVCDDAIDTEKTDMEKYGETHDLSLLVFKPDCRPTVFYFSHPKKIENKEKLNTVFMGIRGLGKEQDAGKLMRNVWNVGFLGTSEGFGEMRVDPMRNDRGALNEEYIQALVDCNVFDELAGAFLAKMNEKTDSSELKKS